MENSEKAVGTNRIQRFVSILFLVFSGTYLFLSFSLPLGKVAKPGPGMVPRGIGIVLTLLSLVHVIEVFFFEKSPSARKSEDPLKKEDIIRVAGIVFLLILYMILFPTLGYFFSTIILVGVVLRLLEMHGWILIVFISIITSGCTYFFFDRILDVPLPKGIMPF